MWETGCDRSLRVLGCTKNDSWDEIKAKYRELIKRFHPDNHEGNQEEKSEKIKEITFAYDYLKRNDYQPITSRKTAVKIKKSQKTTSDVQKNEEAFTSRRMHCKGKGFYCWDPDYEDYGSFSGSIRSECERVINSRREQFFVRESFGSVKAIDLVTYELMFRLAYYMKSEFVKPYFV